MPCAYIERDWYKIQASNGYYIIPKLQGAITTTLNLKPHGNRSIPDIYIATDQGVMLRPKDKKSNNRFMSNKINGKLHLCAIGLTCEEVQHNSTRRALRSFCCRTCFIS